MSESANEIYENIEWNETKETVQDMRVEIKSLKKAKTEIKLEMTNLVSQIKLSEVLPTEYKTQRNLSDMDDKIRKMDTSVKENSKYKNSRHEISRNLGYNKKTKSINNRNKRRRRNSGQRYRKYFQLKKKIPIKVQ